MAKLLIATTKKTVMAQMVMMQKVVPILGMIVPLNGSKVICET